MANGLYRLEKFFSKRKTSAATSEQLGPTAPIIESAEPQFPSPSFIRPKGNRMAAREEVRSKQVPTRSPSVPDLLMSQGLTSTHTRNTSSSSSSSPKKPSSARSASLRSRNQETFLSALNGFQFPEPPSHNGDYSPLSLTFSSTKSISESHRQPSSRSYSPVHLDVPPNRVDTPPSSDPEDEPSPRTYYSKKLPPLPPPRRAPPTPDESPELAPVPDTKLRQSKSLDVLGKALYKFTHQLGEPFDEDVPKRKRSQPSLLPAPRFSRCSSTLREPGLTEFLQLSDDDIAESSLEGPLLSPLREASSSLSSMSLSTPASGPRTPSLLTLAPPVPGNASTAAAFEAARIANRYDFDLVYVVNLWPTSDSPNRGPTAQRPMTGRLLAAHGLHRVPSPLQISAAVHCKVLRSDGWIEYQNMEAKPCDLARGYACAFYPGEHSRKGSVDSNAPVSGVRLSERIDRGIVFAAYRKPRVGVERLGAALKEKDLGSLHDDAEALVHMLIDIHVTNQLRRPCSLDRLSDSTGPIPVTSIGVS